MNQKFKTLRFVLLLAISSDRVVISAFGGGWGYSQKSVDAILMTTDTDILLYGLGGFHFI